MKFMSIASLVLLTVACGKSPVLSKPTNSVIAANPDPMNPVSSNPNSASVANPNAANPIPIANTLNGNVLGSPMVLSNAAYATYKVDPRSPIVSYQVFLGEAPLCPTQNGNQPYSGRVVTFLLDANGTTALDGNYLLNDNQPFIPGQTGTLAGTVARYTNGVLGDVFPTGPGMVHIDNIDPNQQLGIVTGSFDVPVESFGSIDGTFHADPCPQLNNADRL